MAFQSAAGYGNLPNGNFSPVIYSKKVQKQFRKTSVCSDITNTDYFGEISGMGDSVKIMKEPEIAINDYARGTKLTSQDIVDEDFTLLIDRARAFQFSVDDIETAHSHVNFQALATDRAGYKLKDEFDRDILAYMCGYEYNKTTGLWTARTAPVGTNAESTAGVDELLAANKFDEATWGGTAGESIVMGVSGTYTATPLQILNRMNRYMTANNVPTDNRWVVVDPVFLEVLQDEDSKFMNADYQDGEQLSNGKVTSMKVRGFRVYASNNLPSFGTGPDTATAGGSTTDYGLIIAGHDSAVATAETITKTESFRATDTFGDVVRGMHVYGRKILRPEAIITAAYNIN